MNKKAFTLAEVLVTLGIIGIVAALTLPSLISKYQNKVFATKTKKTYSLIEQAIQKYQAENGTVGDVSGLFDTSKTSQEVLANLAKYFNVVKLCNSSKECPNGNYKVLYTKPLYWPNGSAQYNQIKMPYFILADGSIISVSQLSSCERTMMCTNFNSDGTTKIDASGNPVQTECKQNYCASVTFDINGNSAPNQFGRDVFEIRYSADGKTNGWGNTGYENLKNILLGKDISYVKYNFNDKKD